MKRNSPRQRGKWKVVFSVIVVGLATSGLVAGMLYLVGRTRPHF
jgi:hypothetical protein